MKPIQFVATFIFIPLIVAAYILAMVGGIIVLLGCLLAFRLVHGLPKNTKRL